MKKPKIRYAESLPEKNPKGPGKKRKAKYDPRPQNLSQWMDEKGGGRNEV